MSEIISISQNVMDMDTLCQNSIELIHYARGLTVRQINIIELLTNYTLGRWIVEEQQNGANRAKYGQKVIQKLSASLTEQFGRGYSVDNLENMRKFYIAYRERISETLFRKFAMEKSETLSRILKDPPFRLSFSHYLIKPLNTITQRIALSETNMDFKMEDAYKTGDEVEELARAFADLSQKTAEYLDQVKRVTAEKERIGAELSLATQIQESMLPHIVPAFPDRKDFDIIGSMDPAKEVGGDFYDYFLINEDHLCMVIADVSGKGVPEATDASGEMFGTERMISALNARPNAEPMEVLKNMRSAVDGFVLDAEQFDDLTMLCLEYKGSGPKSEMKGG